MYRVTWPAEALQAQGHDVDISSGLQAVWQDDLISGAKRLVGAEDPSCDVIVLQRPLDRRLADVIPMLQRHGTAVVVEIDDDFLALPPDNASFSGVHPRLSPDRNWNHLLRACAQADLVTCTTPALARRYAKHGRVAVLPNCVPERYLRIVGDRGGDACRVGWSGSVSTHGGDLEVPHGAVGRVVRDTGAVFRIVGTGMGVKQRLGLDAFEVCGWVPIEEYPLRLAELDVGIVPLADSAFNSAKSWLKGLEYAAVGVPFVASSTGPYRDLSELGAGDIAARPRQWESMLRRLVRDRGYRAERAEEGRQVAAELTIEGNAWRWWEAWSDALAHRRERSAA